ncbi:PREDICTED: receptor-type tyrosine-protein phosphatase delta-like [Priapulus caudatus]|uniref:Receptor-type tyrosine-protein phosphatase delta-like n=1 Tax=Priapulus caudatus TaxID=37621 RepID=A0ABM1DY41_PRICU|nr:PREDICTED: receptor-type tyrosine-protein phosphatase delta-like [Priapulus caudatus]
MNDGSCDSEDGACACSDPWVGEDCTERIASVLMFASLSVHTDTYVRLRCVAAGIPLPTVNIREGGFKLASICKNTMADTVECEHVLLPSATANYTCEASNAHGSNSAQATLTIVDPPRLVSPPSVTEIPNSPSSLQVAWKAWQYGVDEGGKEDDTITYKLRYRPQGERTWVVLTTPRTNLTVQFLAANTAYEFAVQCIGIETGVGLLSPIANATSPCAPLRKDTSRLREATIDRVTSHDISLSWIAPSESSLGCGIESYVLDYRAGASGPYTNVLIPATHTSYTLEELDPGVTYDIRLSLNTTAGETSDSVRLQTTTSNNAPGTVQNLVTTASNFSVAVTWDPPIVVVDNMTGYVVTYILKNRKNCETVSRGASQMATVSMDRTYVELEGLLPYSDYEISAQVQAASGKGPKVKKRVRTLEAAPDGAPEVIMFRNIGEKNIDVGWEPIECLRSNGMLTQYEYSVSDHHGNVKQTGKVPAYDRQIHLKSLTPYTEYDVALRARTVAGAGLYSPPVHFSTLESEMGRVGTSQTWSSFVWSWKHNMTSHGQKAQQEPTEWAYELINKKAFDIPEAPAQLWSRLVSEQSFTLVWREPRAPNGIITDYKVSWSALESYDPLLQLYTVSQQTADNRSLSSVVTGLHPATKYTTRVSARTSKGEGQAVSESYWTKIAVPPAPKAPTVYAHQESTKTVTIAIPAIQLSTGPLSAVKIVVQSDERITRGQLCINLTDHHEAMLADLSCYVTGEMDEEAVKRETYFVIGDDRVYGGYRNVPLMNTEMSSVFLHTVSAFQQELKTSRSEAMPLPGTDDPSTGWLVFGYPWWYLLVLIIIVLVVVLLCVLIIVSARRRKERSRPEYAAHWSVSYRAQDGDVDSIPESMFCNARDSDYSNSTSECTRYSRAL